MYKYVVKFPCFRKKKIYFMAFGCLVCPFKILTYFLVCNGGTLSSSVPTRGKTATFTYKLNNNNNN